MCRARLNCASEIGGHRNGGGGRRLKRRNGSCWPHSKSLNTGEGRSQIKPVQSQRDVETLDKLSVSGIIYIEFRESPWRQSRSGLLSRVRALHFHNGPRQSNQDHPTESEETLPEPPFCIFKPLRQQYFHDKTVSVVNEGHVYGFLRPVMYFIKKKQQQKNEL